MRIVNTSPNVALSTMAPSASSADERARQVARQRFGQQDVVAPSHRAATGRRRWRGASESMGRPGAGLARAHPTRRSWRAPWRIAATWTPFASCGAALPRRARGARPRTTIGPGPRGWHLSPRAVWTFVSDRGATRSLHRRRGHPRPSHHPQGVRPRRSRAARGDTLASDGGAPSPRGARHRQELALRTARGGRERHIVAHGAGYGGAHRRPDQVCLELRPAPRRGALGARPGARPAIPRDARGPHRAVRGDHPGPPRGAGTRCSRRCPRRCCSSPSSRERRA